MLLHDCIHVYIKGVCEFERRMTCLRKMQPHCCISYGSIDGGSGSGDTDTVA